MQAGSVGVDIGGTGLQLLSADAERAAPTGRCFTGADAEALIRAFVNAQPQPVRRIGIAVPGLVDAAGDVAISNVLPELAGWSPRRSLADLGCHVAVLNDVDAALLQEFDGAPAGLTAGMVMVGTAVGSAFVVHGQRLRGTSGWAGELGFMPLPVDGGVRRLDELAGGGALLARTGRDAPGLQAALQAGDEQAMAAVAEAGAHLGRALAMLINLFNPQRLAVGGGTLGYPGLWEAARREAQAWALAPLWADCRLYTVTDGKRLVARGAALAAATGLPEESGSAA
jgi:predicted NBD/HSP70 family sugar kinase